MILDLVCMLATTLDVIWRTTLWVVASFVVAAVVNLIVRVAGDEATRWYARGWGREDRP